MGGNMVRRWGSVSHIYYDQVRGVGNCRTPALRSCPAADLSVAHGRYRHRATCFDLHGQLDVS